MKSKERQKLEKRKEKGNVKQKEKWELYNGRRRISGQNKRKKQSKKR